MDDNVSPGGGSEGTAGVDNDDSNGAGASGLSGDVVEETTGRAEHLTLALSGKFQFPDGEMPGRYQQVEDDVTDEEDEPFAEMLRAVLRLGYMMGIDDAFSGFVRVDQGSGEAKRGEGSGAVTITAGRLRVLQPYPPSPFGGSVAR